MRIVTKLLLKNLLAIAIVVAMGGMLLAMIHSVKTALRQAEIASEIVDGTATLRFLAFEYLTAPGERAETQWRLKHQSLRAMIAAAGSQDLRDSRQLEAMDQQLALLKEGYDRLVLNIPEAATYSPRRVYVPNEYARKLAATLVVNIQALIGNATTLEEQSRARVIALLDRAQGVFVLVGIGLSLMLLSVMFVVTRDIARRLSRLREGAEEIGLAKLDYRIERPSGDEIGVVEASFNKMADQLSSQRQALVAEIAGRTKAEEGLIQTNHTLAAMNKEMEAFSYSVSHDLRSPIRAMVGFSQILIEDYGPRLPPGAQESLRVIQDEGQRMGRLIDDLLSLSRVTRDALRRESVDLSALARQVLDALHKAEPKRACECLVADRLMATGDARLLKIALDNLLGNAWKFTGHTARPRIEFGTVSDNGALAFFVRDNGAGFDMAYVDKLFGAFQRLHSGEEFPGTGIGLAIVQRIVNRHGGRVWAEGAKDQGATFYFSL